MTYNHSSVTIEAHLDSVTIDNGEPIAIPPNINNLVQFVDWFADQDNVNPFHINQAINILKQWITNKRSFSELRSRK